MFYFSWYSYSFSSLLPFLLFSIVSPIYILCSIPLNHILDSSPSTSNHYVAMLCFFFYLHSPKGSWWLSLNLIFYLKVYAHLAPTWERERERERGGLEMFSSSSLFYFLAFLALSLFLAVR